MKICQTKSLTLSILHARPWHIIEHNTSLFCLHQECPVLHTVYKYLKLKQIMQMQPLSVTYFWTQCTCCSVSPTMLQVCYYIRSYVSLNSFSTIWLHHVKFILNLLGTHSSYCILAICRYVSLDYNFILSIIVIACKIYKNIILIKNMPKISTNTLDTQSWN